MIYKSKNEFQLSKREWLGSILAEYWDRPISDILSGIQTKALRSSESGEPPRRVQAHVFVDQPKFCKNFYPWDDFIFFSSKWPS